jgi:cyclase
VAPTTLPRSEHYQFETLGDGIVFAQARREGTALSNAGVVDLDGSGLLFDTGLTLRAARDLEAVTRALTGRPPQLTANSHWHLDHVLGNQLFSERPIYATRRTVELLLEQRGALETELSREKLEADVRELAESAKAATHPTVRREYEFVLNTHRALLEEAVDLKLTPPTAGFERELELPGHRSARLVTFGSGHTESDALLLLPRDRILFAGDLVVVGQHPNLTSGDPGHWREVLDRVRELRPERIVPGHGPLASLETVAEIREYLAQMLELAGTSGHVDVPSAFRHWHDFGQFEENLKFVRSRYALGAPKG